MSTTFQNASLCTLHKDISLPAYIAGGCWQPSRTDDYAADCQHGREIADDILRRATDDNPLYFSTVVRGVVEAGRWEGVEIGLFSKLGIALA